MHKQERRVKALIKLGLFLISLICFPSSIHAAEVLPSGLVIGDDQGLYAASTGEYYIDLDDVRPGDHYRKEITIRSLDLKEPFDLGLLVSKKEATGSLDWNEHVIVRLTLDGKQIYEGPLLGDGSFDWTMTPLELGTCRYGTDKLLVAEFEVDSQITTNDLLESSELLFQWTFVGVKQPVVEPPLVSSEEPTIPSTTPSSSPTSEKQLPKTGEQAQRRIIQVIGILLLLIVLLLWKKRQNERR